MRSTPAPPSVANTSLVGTATPGLTSTAGEFRQRERIGQDLADAAHHARTRIDADRHVGAGRARGREQPRVVERDAVLAREQAQCRRRVGRAAAEPGRDRQALSSVKRPSRKPSTRCGERARRLEHEIVVGGAGRRGGRAGDLECERLARREA